MIKRICLGSLLIILILAPGSSPGVTAAVLLPAENLLPNGNFESFEDWKTPMGLAFWERWWIIDRCEKPSPSDLNYACEPNGFYREDARAGGADFVRSGYGAVTIRNNWDPWEAGVKQTISVTVGTRVRLTAYGHLWAAMEDWSWTVPSDTYVRAVTRVGLDLNGADYPTSTSQVIWSGAASPHDTWIPLSVAGTVGPSGRVTVILYANYRGYGYKYMTSSWDDASLSVERALYIPLIVR